MNCKCENCECNHNGEYGSGRFCSSKCARGFSTKSKRKEINEKVRQKLTGSGNDQVQKTCPGCGKLFSVAWKLRKQKCCSQSCSSSVSNKNPSTKKKQSLARIKAIKDGKGNHYGTKCEYNFRGIKIQCDSKIEYSCLNYFEAVMGADQMRRCDEVITYLDDGVTRDICQIFL